ncbi:MAG: CDP-diacylglycerol--glycerol-3-phosphate 3-phosphatidyltransferase [Gammaproteobacteria bacterium]|nr:MAG: CDP-diacylglycerol--glycerol-3-phosphate 3-phosphatidyltransferase [Gammaproteobacteria bacterium]
MWNLPNILTLMRIAMIPILICVFYLPWEWRHLASAAIFGIAAGTDWLDGYLARKLDQFTPFGAFLDPVADKLIVASALVMLMEEHATLLFALPTMVIIGREIVISALREWMAELGKRTSVAVSYLGKVKTTLQMIAIAFLLAINPVTHPMLDYLGIALLYVAAILTLWSMIIYLRAAWPELSRVN